MCIFLVTKCKCETLVSTEVLFIFLMTGLNPPRKYASKIVIKTVFTESFNSSGYHEKK
jgi:hypothetical protein